ncbi:MAG: porin [Terracidiphilus sp.]
MFSKPNRILQMMAGAAMATALIAGAQDPAPAATPAAAQAPPAPATPPPAPTWSVGPMDISGFIDGYYSFNFNRPNTSDALYDQVNQLYNFNDKTDQFELSAAKLTLNHDPDPVGAHVDFIYGRTNTLINAAPTNATSADQIPYIEQAFLSLKPPKAKGFELDFGKFVTSAGAEVIEAKDNWNYSRSLLFVNAIPYWHFGARTSLPVSKTDTIGFQLVNGWNNVSKSNGGVTGVFTNALVKPKATWNLNYIVGPENANTTSGLRNLFDTTLLLTPPGKFNAYINFDFGENQDAIAAQGDTLTHDWYGVAFAAHIQASGKSAITPRFEWFDDPDGFQTGTAQTLYEGTFTYEYKWVEGLLSRVEYRYDQSSNSKFFNKLGNQSAGQQQTLTVAFIAFFGPKR